MTDPATALRAPEQVMSLSASTWPFDPRSIEYEATDGFVDALAGLGVTLLVSREYEHLVLALSADEHGLDISVARLPHPSGIAVDRVHALVHIACTRNPNQVVTYGLSGGFLDRDDVVVPHGDGPLLAPRSTRFLPGSHYLHDLALVDGRLHGNAVGMNAVVDLDHPEPTVVWWPSTVERAGVPQHGRNLVQLNSIAAGPSLAESYFTASTEGPTDRLPGDPAWEIDRRGVVFAGDGRVVARGLTRPHSARRAADGTLWVDDSGYGSLCRIDGAAGGQGSVEVVTALQGWTRGLCLLDRAAVVGTSRVLPRFAAYAPGLDPLTSRCGLHLVDLAAGRVTGSLWFPHGDQIFAIDWLPRSTVRRFVGGTPGDPRDTVDAAWYSFAPVPVGRPSPQHTETPT